MSSTSQILRITDQDIPAIVKLINSAYEGVPGSRSWTSESDLVEGQRTTEEALLKLIHQPSITMLKYVSAQGEPLGCVLLEKKADTLYLGMLSVSPHAQATGIGKALMEKGEIFARENGYNNVTITVIDQRPELIDWYARKGYRSTGRTERFANKSSRQRVPFSFIEMRKKL